MKNNKIAIKCADGTTVYMNGESTNFFDSITVKNIIAGSMLGITAFAMAMIAYATM